MLESSRLSRRAVVAVLFSLVLMAPAAARADEAMKARHREVGLGLASVLANVIYVPAKLAYAAVGTVTSGVAWALTGGNNDVTKGILVSSIGGDYFLDRQMVAGHRKIYFSGPIDERMHTAKAVTH